MAGNKKEKWHLKRWFTKRRFDLNPSIKFCFYFGEDSKIFWKYLWQWKKRGFMSYLSTRLHPSYCVGE